MHNVPNMPAAALRLSKSSRTTSRTVVRPAVRADATQIVELVSDYAAQGLMLPRTLEHVATRIDNYVVAVDGSGRIIACAALEEYSPSLGEVSSVAVSPQHHGRGLGTQVVLGVERLARARDIEELFALSLTDNFFLSLSYVATTISRYPEKLVRYDELSRAGVEIVPKRCFKKVLDRAWAAPRLVAESPAVRQKRKAV